MDLPVILHIGGIVGDQMIGARRVELTSRAAGPTEQQVGRGFPSEASVESQTAARVAIRASEILHTQEVAAEFNGMGTNNLGGRGRMLIIVERPHLGQVVGRTENNVPGSLELRESTSCRILGSAGKSYFRGPILFGTVRPALIVGLAGEGALQVEEPRGSDRSQVIDIREQAERVVRGPKASQRGPAAHLWGKRSLG